MQLMICFFCCLNFESLNLDRDACDEMKSDGRTEKLHLLNVTVLTASLNKMSF